MGEDIFERLNKERPSTEKIISEQDQKIQHAQKVLDWLQRWDKPVVRRKDFRVYGPRPRDRKSMLDSTEILVRNGWLSPIRSRRYDGHTWQVIRKPTIAPEVAK
jgi:hypothetical protein